MPIIETVVLVLCCLDEHYWNSSVSFLFTQLDDLEY